MKLMIEKAVTAYEKLQTKKRETAINEAKRSAQQLQSREASPTL